MPEVNNGPAAAGVVTDRGRAAACRPAPEEDASAVLARRKGLGAETQGN